MSRTLEVWRLTWPKSIPAEDFETALMLAQLIESTERKKAVKTAKVEKEKAPRVYPKDMMPAGLTPDQAASVLGCKRPWIYKLVRDGTLIRVGGTSHPMLITAESIDRYKAGK